MRSLGYDPEKILNREALTPRRIVVGHTEDLHGGSLDRRIETSTPGTIPTVYRVF